MARLTGGAVQMPDGTWQAGCMFAGLSEEEAMRLSVWLERLVTEHLHETVSEVFIEEIKH